MKVTIGLLEGRFEEYNEKYFNCALKYPQLKLLKSYTTLGMFSCRRMTKSNRKLSGAKIEISCYIDWEEAELRDVMVHEMIHYYLAYMHIDTEITHCEAFLEMAERLNREHSLNIRVKPDASNYKRLKGAPLLSWWWCHIFG